MADIPRKSASVSKEKPTQKTDPNSQAPTKAISSKTKDNSHSAAAAAAPGNLDDSDDIDTEIEEVRGEGDEVTVKKLSWIQKKKKGLAGKAATSALGKTLLDKYIDADTKLLLKSIKKIITKEDGSKKASQVKHDIIKIAVKLIFLHDEKKITENSFNGITFAFRRICSSIRNAYQKRNLDLATAERIHLLTVQFSSGIVNVIQPYVQKKTIDMIESVIGYLGDPNFLVKVSKHKEFEQIAYVLASYLQS